MIILTNPSTLELVLGSSVTTSQLPYYIAYVDSTSTTHNPLQGSGVSNDTTIVTMLSTPVVATTRTIKYISIHNKDTTSKQIFIQINDTVNTRTLVDFTLDAGDRIEYTDTVGFRVISSLGEVKTVSTGNSITPTSLTKVDDTNVTLTLGGSPTTALLQATSLTLGWTGTLADSRIASATTWNAKQAPFTILSTLGGLANASGVLTNNGAGVLSWGAAGGSQTPWTSNINAAGYTLFGNSISGGTLTLSSTSHATKGKILFGTSAYDEVNNRLGIGQTTPTAILHLKAGTATANTAPLKLTSGTNLTTAEAGAFEYNGTSLFFTRSGTLRADILMTDIATPFNTYSASLKGATAFTTGNNNILLGNSAGSAMTTGVDNILIGRSTSTGTGGSQNIAIGTATTAGGNYNVSIGALAGTSSINATNAVSIGNSANYYSFNPNNGIAIGASAESGLGDNVSIGANAVSAYAGTNNVTVGGSAGRYAASGAGNTLIGNRTGTSLTTGAYNVALGFQSGNAITTGSKNIAIGYDVDPQSNTANGQLTIQNAIFGTDNIGVGTTVSTGNIGIYVVSPLARLHLPAGATGTNTAPLKFTSGTNLTTPENGAMEFDGTNLYFTVGGVRKTIQLL